MNFLIGVSEEIQLEIPVPPEYEDCIRQHAEKLHDTYRKGLKRAAVSLAFARIIDDDGTVLMASIGPGMM